MSKVNDNIMPAVPDSVLHAAAEAYVVALNIGSTGEKYKAMLMDQLVTYEAYRSVRAAIESAYRAGVESISPKPIRCKHCGGSIVHAVVDGWLHEGTGVLSCYLTATPAED